GELVKRRALVPALLVAACSSGHHPAASSGIAGDPLQVVPKSTANACDDLPKAAIKDAFGADVKHLDPRKPRATQSLQTGCDVSLNGEKQTSLAIYLWHGTGFERQWQDEMALTGDSGLATQPYGIEAYGAVVGTGTELAVRERNFAVRIICGPKPSSPDK